MKRWGLLLLAIALLASCTNWPETGQAPGDDDQAGKGYVLRSDQFHLQVTVPPGWAVAEGPISLGYITMERSGLLAFNSWGEGGFWDAGVIHSTGIDFNNTDNLPDGGAYVGLIDEALRGGSYDVDGEYQQQDLSGLWQSADCREGAISPGVSWVGFLKWGRRLSLEVKCHANASEATVAAVNALLESWRFDPIPVGDKRWAMLEARKLLPAVVEPELFSHTGEGTGFWIVPGENMGVRFSRIETQDDTLIITFMYRWNIEPGEPISDDCPPERCHWWRVEVRPSGEAALVAEGGAPLPDR